MAEVNAKLMRNLASENARLSKRAARGPSRPRFNNPTNEYRGVKPTPVELEPEPNFDLIDDVKKEELRAKARAKVEAREKDRAYQAFLDAEVDRLDREAHPEAYEEEKEIFIDPAVYADRIILDGHHYMYGRTYTVKKRVYDTLIDIIAQTKKHHRNTHRDPNEALMQAQRAITKDGPSYATVGNSGVTRF